MMARSNRSTRIDISRLTFALAASLGIGVNLARADVLNDWNIIADTEAGLIRPTAHGRSRGIAMVQGAVYDAVNAIDRGYQPYLLAPDAVGAQPWASQDAAIATAAHDVLVAIVDVARVAGLDTSYATTLAGIPPGLAKDEGIRVGTAA